MRKTWDAARVMAALNALRDHGISVRQMTRESGANRSTIYRWMSGGDGQPDYDLVNRLAAAVWPQHPSLARELVEASGYAWAEPTDQTAPAPLIDPQVEADIRRLAESEEEAEMLLRAMRDRRLEKLRTTDGKPAA